MLKNLQIRNYALIKELQLAPSPKLNIITGETGAGKSIMLGALGLLLGNRADTKVLLDENEKCIIEGEFDITSYDIKDLFEEEGLDYDHACIIRREISPQNKSRAFINDTPVTLDVLKKVSGRLMDIHSQHETLLLGSSDFQTVVLDAFADNQKRLQVFREKFSTYKKTLLKYEALKHEAAEAQKTLDYHSFLLKELQDAQLVAGELEELEQENKILENAEEIKSRLNIVKDALGSGEPHVLSLLQQAVKNLQAAGNYSKDLEGLHTRLDSCFIEIKDISAEVEEIEEKFEFNEERMVEVRERLSLLYSLQHKHQVLAIDELLRIRDELAEKVTSASGLEESIERVHSELQAQWAEVLDRSAEISQRRKAVVPALLERIHALLVELGMPNAKVDIDIKKIEPVNNGADKVTFLFSANKGVVGQELRQVASGGEFSRLMLAIKYLLAEKMELPLIIFDEIDTGVSGEIAIKMGKIMKQMAVRRQLIAISHLPQIAAMGNAHYFVYKDNSSSRTFSNIKPLAEDERILHIAKMIGGDQPSETALLNARELMSLGHS